MNSSNTTPYPPIVIVMPCFNEADCLPLSIDDLCRRLKPDLGEIGGDWGLLLVDDGSADETWEVIQCLCSNRSGARGIRLSENVGQQAATLSGYHVADSDWVVSMDSDLQDPPESIVDMLEVRDQGYSVIVGHRRTRHVDSPMKRLTAWGFYCTAQALGVSRKAMQSSEFRLMSRGAAATLTETSKVPLFNRFAIFELGYSIASVEFDRTTRIAGETKYTIAKMISLARQAVWGSRTAVTRIASACIGLQVFMSAWLIMAVALQSNIRWLAIALSLQLLILTWFLTSIALVIYRSVRPLPLYQIAERCGDWCPNTHPARAQAESTPASIAHANRQPTVTG